MQTVIVAMVLVFVGVLCPGVAHALSFNLRFNGAALVDGKTHPVIQGTGVRTIYLACGGTTLPTTRCISDYRPSGLTSPTIRVEDTTTVNRARLEARVLNGIISVAIKGAIFRALSGVTSTGSGLQLDYSGGADTGDLPALTGSRMYAGVFVGTLKTSLGVKASLDTAALTVCASSSTVNDCFDTNLTTGNVVNVRLGDPLDPEAPSAAVPPFTAGDTLGSFAQDETEDGIGCSGTCPRIRARMTWRPRANGNVMTISPNTSGGHVAEVAGPAGAAAMRQFLGHVNVFTLSPSPECNLKFEIQPPLPTPTRPDQLPPILPLKARAFFALTPDADQCPQYVLQSVVSDDDLGDVVAENNNVQSVLFVPRPGTLKFADLLDTKLNTSVAAWQYVSGDCGGSWLQVAVLSDGTEVSAQNGTTGPNFTTGCAGEPSQTTSGVNVWHLGDLRYAIDGVFVGSTSELNNLKSKQVKYLEWRLGPRSDGVDQAVRIDKIAVDTDDGLFTFEPLSAAASTYVQTPNLPDAAFFRVVRLTEPRLAVLQPVQERTPNGEYVANFATSQLGAMPSGTYRIEIVINSQVFPNFVPFELMPPGM